MREFKIGSRGSDLALWQANHIKVLLEKHGINTRIVVIKTQGDKIQDLSFDKMEGKGFFTKELETALRDHTIDMAVHSYKDLETTSLDDLSVMAVSEREDPSDVLIIRKEKFDPTQKWGLQHASCVGTSSARRKSQVLAHRPDLSMLDLRGNVPTRIQKLVDKKYDAILLAYAGIKRLELDMSSFHLSILDPTVFVPAPAQGMLGIQIRSQDDQVRQFVTKIQNIQLQKSINMERQILNLVQGGCQVPLGVYCQGDKTIHIAYAKKWQNGAKYFRYTIDPTLDIEQIVAQLTSDKNVS